MSQARALFQLGMDLETPRTTQQEETHVLAVTGPANENAVFENVDDRKDFFIERDGERFAGTHLIVDLWDAQGLDDLAHMEAAMREAVEAAGATLLHFHLHHFTPNDGISGVAVLAESHISVHTWPEAGYAAFDVFMCGNAEPHKAVEVLERAFRPSRIDVGEHFRGRGL